MFSSSKSVISPVIHKWDEARNGISPTCIGCSGGGWSYDPGSRYWCCGKCKRPSHIYLKECNICAWEDDPDAIWLPPYNPGAAVDGEKYQNLLNHPKCEAMMRENDAATH